MKARLHSKLYDTDTAKKIGQALGETLYQKRTGEYFLHMSDNSISPVDPETAAKWAEAHLPNEKFERLFSDLDFNRVGAEVKKTVRIDAGIAAFAEKRAAADGLTFAKYLEKLITKDQKEREERKVITEEKRYARRRADMEANGIEFLGPACGKKDKKFYYIMPWGSPNDYIEPKYEIEGKEKALYYGLHEWHPTTDTYEKVIRQIGLTDDRPRHSDRRDLVFSTLTSDTLRKNFGAPEYTIVCPQKDFLACTKTIQHEYMPKPVEMAYYITKDGIWYDMTKGGSISFPMPQHLEQDGIDYKAFKSIYSK